jgi:HD-like signal output (HDOD) protein
MAHAAVAPPGRLARYTLLREIGQGRRAQVWLAHDPRLDRPVAIKLLKRDGDALSMAASLTGARAASRLAHPNIVPIFEADAHEGQPYLVFEYVEGQTLAQALRQQPLRPAAEAVALLLGVLDALDAAHQQGVVHSALRPSNVLLGRDGRPRLMDFGSAARSLPLPSPAQDVHAAGALLGEMLCGRPLLLAADGAAEPSHDLAATLLLPDQPMLDSRLRGILLRAWAPDLALRYGSARALQADLQAWLQPEVAPAATDSVSNHATLDFLLRRMRHRSDFPALSSAVVRIQRVASSESESVRTLTEEILLDVALTHKLLRLVNTAHYSGLSAGGIGTVSRAVALVGFSGIRNMALSLVLLEHMPDRAHATQLTFEFVRALMVGMVAVELAPRGPAGEDAFLGALFQNLGRLLTEYYLPEEALQIRQQLGSDLAPATAREAAAERVLGIGFDELGAGVARAWGLPDTLQRALRAPVGDWPAHPPEHTAQQGVERLRWLGRSANALVDALQASPSDAQALHHAAEAQAPILGVPVAEVLAATDTARLRLVEAVQALGLVLPAGSAARRLIEPRGASAAELGAADAPDFAGTQAGELSGLMPLSDPAQALLEDALHTARAAVSERSMGPSELLHLVLDALQRALKLRHVVLCLREPGSGGCLVGRLGMGPGGSELSSAFRFTPDATASNDLFAAICARGADLLVADSRTVAARLPAWFRRHVDAPTFLLLPLMVNGRAMGLIYGDRSRAGSLVLREQDLALVRGLRDQVTLAFGRSA